MKSLRQNPLFGQLLETKKETEIEKTTRLLVASSIDRMTASEVDETLRSLGLSTEGSEYQRRFRLRQALGQVPPPSLPGERGHPKIEIENEGEGEFISGTDDKRGLLVLRGRIRVKTSEGEFTASTVIVDANRKEIYGEGGVVYRSKEAEFTGERIIIDQRLGTGILYNASGFQSPVYFIGESITQTAGIRYAVSHAHFTTCSSERPHYNFKAKKIWIYSDDKIVAAGVLFYIGGVPLLPLPFLYASDWGTGIITQIGYGTVQGGYIQNTYQFAVPSAYYSPFLPISYRLKADAYENTGSMGGVELMRFTPGLNYFIDLSGANFKRYESKGDYRATNGIHITNQVRRKDGTVGEEIFHWYKGFGIIHASSKDASKNSVRDVHIRFEDYTNRLFEYEFGGRFLPESTIPALYKYSETGHGLIQNTTNWNIVWNEIHDDVSFRVEATRNRIWFDSIDPLKSRYVPVNDVVPSVDIKKKSLIGSIPFLNGSAYWDANIHTDISKIYSGGKFFRSQNNNLFSTGFRFNFSLYPYFTFQPSVGYGVQKTMVESANTDASIERQAKLNSYEFGYSNSVLTIGPEFLFLKANYRRKDSFKEELKDQPTLNLTGFENNQKVNETELSIEINPLYDLNFSITGVYDHRRFEYEVRNQDRWSYAVFRSDLFLDFVNLFRPSRENLLSRKKLHFLGLRLTNDLIYDPVLSRYHSDVFGSTFQAGGFNIWPLRRLRFFESGFYWYHIYHDPALDHMRYFTKIDVQISKNIYYELELESRATEVEKYFRSNQRKLLPPIDPANLEESLLSRYLIENLDPGIYAPAAAYRNAYVPFHDDILFGTGSRGANRQQNAVFNIGYVDTALVIDLHDWELRLGYALEQRAIFGGINSLDIINFYDNKVYISLNLIRFDLERIGSRPSRFVVNRRRVRSSDIGRTGISTERLY